MDAVLSTGSAQIACQATASRPRFEALRRWLQRSAIRTAGAIVTALLLAAAPVWMLVSGALQLHVDRGWNPWLALASAALAAVSLLSLYGGWAALRLTGRFRFRLVAARVALPLVVLVCAYSLAFLPAMNAKTGRIRDGYSELHPILRAAVGIYGLLDGGFVLTDLTREPADYARLGLRVPARSLHYLQSDGTTHALDLRTVGRSWPRNAFAQLYFAALGFDTLRHVGTADHLHVAVPGPATHAAAACSAQPDSPGAYCALD